LIEIYTCNIEVLTFTACRVACSNSTRPCSNVLLVCQVGWPSTRHNDVRDHSHSRPKKCRYTRGKNTAQCTFLYVRSLRYSFFRSLL